MKVKNSNNVDAQCGGAQSATCLIFSAKLRNKQHTFHKGGPAAVTPVTEGDAPRTSINKCIVGGATQPMMDFISGMYGPADDTRLEAQAASIPISFHMIIPNFTADGFSLRQTAAAKCQSTDENARRLGEKVERGRGGRPAHTLHFITGVWETLRRECEQLQDDEA